MSEAVEAENTEATPVEENSSTEAVETTETPAPSEEIEATPETEEAPPSEETPAEPEAEEGVVGYQEYDNPLLNSVTDILKGAEIPAEDAQAIFLEAAQTADISKINVQALVDKLGQAKADTVMALVETYYNKELSKNAAILTDIHGMVGGEERYNAMIDWAGQMSAKDPAFEAKLVDLRKMVDTGLPMAIKAAMSNLFDMYKNDPNTTIPAELTTGERPGSHTGLEPLSRSEYTDLVEKAHREGAYSKVRESLWKRRQAGMKKGI